MTIVLQVDLDNTMFDLEGLNANIEQLMEQGLSEEQANAQTKAEDYWIGGKELWLEFFEGAKQKAEQAGDTLEVYLVTTKSGVDPIVMEAARNLSQYLTHEFKDEADEDKVHTVDAYKGPDAQHKELECVLVQHMKPSHGGYIVSECENVVDGLDSPADDEGIPDMLQEWYADECKSSHIVIVNKQFQEQGDFKGPVYEHIAKRHGTPTVFVLDDMKGNLVSALSRGYEVVSFEDVAIATTRADKDSLAVGHLESLTARLDEVLPKPKKEQRQEGFPAAVGFLLQECQTDPDKTNPAPVNNHQSPVRTRPKGR